MKLLYFTESYPYGSGQKWKQYELEALTKSFSDIIVIPFQYGNNKQYPKEAIRGVKYMKPLFEEAPMSNWLMKIIKIFISPFVFVYLKELLKAGMNIHRLSQCLYSSFLIEKLRNHPALKEHLLETDEDTIAYFFWGRNQSELVPILSNKKIKSIIKFHGYDLYAHRYTSKYIPYQESQAKNADLLLSISNDGLHYLKNKYPYAKEKVLLNCLGAVSIGLTRTNIGKLVICSCSRLAEVKRVGIIANAFRYIDNINIEWIHIGDGEEMESIISIIENLPNNITVNMIGSINSDDVLSVYMENKVDLFVNVSSSEGVPVSIMEAMSVGIPVYATDVGGTSEIVNGENGKLLDSNLSSEDLALEISSYYKLSEEEKKRKRESAFKMYDDNFNATRNAEKLSKLLLQLVKDK